MSRQLFNLLLMPDPLMMPEDLTPAGGLLQDKTITADDLGGLDDKQDDEILDLGEGDDSSKEDEEKPKEIEDEDKKPEDTDDEEDELKAIEEDLKEPGAEDLELTVPVKRRELLKDYPDIFKKHPDLEKVIFRERAYTELLPTVNDAKEALQSREVLNKFEADLMKGDTTHVMKAVLQEDQEAFAKLVDNYMPNLAATDERAYFHVLGNITKDIVTSMLKFAKSKDDSTVADAAATLYQFMFNSTTWEPKQNLSKGAVKEPDEKIQLQKEREEFESQKFQEKESGIMTVIDNRIKATIDKNIDINSQMSDFVKNKATQEVLDKAKDLLKRDTRFQQILKQTWDRAKKEKYSEESVNRVRSTYLSKYKAVLAPIIKAVRKEALKGTTKKVKDTEEINDTSDRANRGIPRTRNANSGNKNDVTKPGASESSLDFLLRRSK